jgi:hypothetical protein
MPINGQCGFVFLNNVSAEGVARVAAHELGHGAFRLYHTFSSDNRYILPEGTTDNLMDYNGGTALYKYQWDYIHDPQTLLFAWAEEEEEGAMITRRSATDEIPYIATKIRRDTVFYHSGETIYLLKQSKSYKFFYIKKHQFVIPGDTVFVDIPLDTIQWNFNGIVTNNKPIEINTSALNVGQTYKLRAHIPPQYTSFTIGTLIYKPKIDSTYNLEYSVIIVDNPIIEFTRSKTYQGEYGFDNDFWSCNTVNCYDTTKINGVEYKIPWLSMRKGQVVNIQALIKISTDQYKALKKLNHEFKFYGSNLNINGVIDTFKVNINTLNSGDNLIDLTLSTSQETTGAFTSPEKLYAKSGNEIAGKLNFFCKDESKSHNVELNIIPMFIDMANLTTNIDTNQVETYFNNRAYNQAFVKWDVKGHSAILISWNTDSLILKQMITDAYNHNWHTQPDRNYLRIIYDIKSGTLNQYDAGTIQHFLLWYFSKKNTGLYDYIYNNKGKYLMFITDLNQNGGEDGIGMVNGRVCTIFKNGIGSIPTYIHEVGHNLGLSHVFDNTGKPGERGTLQGKSEHYMDYFNSKKIFWKTDWEFIYQQTTP